MLASTQEIERVRIVEDLVSVRHQFRLSYAVVNA
jgi:hypothetical protein